MILRYCRGCGCRDLEQVLDLGLHHANAFLGPSDPLTSRWPLVLVMCQACSLVQLGHVAHPDLFYRHYWYRSGVTRTMREALADVVQKVRAEIELTDADTVVDIGSNDSTLLRAYGGCRRIGFEPATNLMTEARADGSTIVNDYFTKKSAAFISDGSVSAITAIAMLYDLPDPLAFLEEVKRVMASSGVFVVQVADLLSTLRANDFANVCHEHLEYYSLPVLHRLFSRAGLTIYRVERNSVNGGSLRAYACHEGRLPAAPSEAETDSKSEFKKFAQRVESIRLQVRDMVHHAPQPVYVYGASTKGNTMLQYWNLGYPALAGAAERDERKWGRRMVGGMVPIVSEEEAREKAKTFLVLPWHFREEIVQREAAFTARGGRLIFPLPVPVETNGK